ncbi:MAG: rRNA maturation RNase YbeY [Christensenellaceae bacterium]|jgi:rRNA maturation RNase YbeY|nr:rRNA maturation RNase YbeY [Christensenellaceae bacterium]
MIEITKKSSYIPLIKSVFDIALTYLEIPEKETFIQVTFLTTSQMRSLNNRARGIDSATDVLSFPAVNFKMPYNKSDYTPDNFNPEDKTLILGEIYICMSKAREQAKEYGHHLKREVAFLALHGLLHLLGFDHLTDHGDKEMNELQDLILEKAKIGFE